MTNARKFYLLVGQGNCNNYPLPTAANGSCGAQIKRCKYNNITLEVISVIPWPKILIWPECSSCLWEGQEAGVFFSRPESPEQHKIPKSMSWKSKNQRTKSILCSSTNQIFELPVSCYHSILINLRLKWLRCIRKWFGSNRLYIFCAQRS